MDSDSMIDAGLGLAVLFVVLQAIGAILTGTPSSNWATGVNQASTSVDLRKVTPLSRAIDRRGTLTQFWEKRGATKRYPEPSF